MSQHLKLNKTKGGQYRKALYYMCTVDNESAHTDRSNESSESNTPLTNNCCESFNSACSTSHHLSKYSRCTIPKYSTFSVVITQLLVALLKHVNLPISTL